MVIEEILKLNEIRESLGRKLKANFVANKSLRKEKETEWLQNLRQIKGIYDPGVLIGKDRSKVYPKMTRKYCRTVLARLHEMLFPETDRNWEMDPSPEPRLSQQMVAGIAEMLMQEKEQAYQQEMEQAQQAQAQGQEVSPPQEIAPLTRDELELAIKEFARETNRRMKQEIDDQLLEMRYIESAKKVLRSGVDYGTGIIKGPLIEKKKSRKWDPIESGGWAENVVDQDHPILSNVRIWDWYPDLSVTELSQGMGSYERHIMNKKDLNKLAALAGFDGKYIKDYMAAHPNGDAPYEPWETDLQGLDVTGGQEQYVSPSGDSAMGQGMYSRDKRYEVVEFWGVIDGMDIAEAGIELEDKTGVYEVKCWLLGNRSICLAQVDGAADIYKLFYFEKDETSIYGTGLPRVMRHSQEAIGASARMILDNGAVVAGPQSEINYSLLMQTQDMTSSYPGKIWWREGRGVESQWPAVRPIQFDSHITELKMIMDTFRQIADEETCLPTWMISAPASTNETAQGASQRMGMLSVAVKDIVRNFDIFTESVIRAMYEWNMEFNDREDIKGDYNIKAQGVSSLIGKETRMQAMTQLRTALQPEDWVYIPRRPFLQEYMKVHDLPFVLRTEQEADAFKQTLSDPELLELEKAAQRSEIKYRDAQALSVLAAAKLKNTNAEKIAGEDKSVDDSVKASQIELNQAKVGQTRADAFSKIMGGVNSGQKKPDKKP